MKPRFIKLTECSTNVDKEVYINAEMIQAISIASIDNKTRVYHPSHNNGGWRVRETPKQILEIINELR